MAALAAVAAVISYSDGLFLVRLAGNTDWHAYLYPLLPDGLIVICLIALLGAGKRAAWPTFGLGLGIALTLAMNVAAGIAHSPLDAVVDGFVPVVFFVAVEVFIGYVKRGRAVVAPRPSPAASPRPVPSSLFEAAKVSMADTARAGNPWSRNQLQTQFRLSRSEADEIWQPYNKRGQGGAGTVPALAAPEPPAGAPPEAPPAPAGALPAMNGRHGA